MHSIKLACLRTSEPLFRTYEPSDHRTFRTESCQCRYRTYEPSEWRTFFFRTYEPSDYRTFGLESSHRAVSIYEYTVFNMTYCKTDVDMKEANLENEDGKSA